MKTKAKTAGIAAITVLTVVAAILAVWLGPRPRLEVFDQKTGEIYYSVPAEDGLRVTLAWVHSIELAPISVTWEVQDARLFLVERTVESYGAGVDNDLGGVTTNENGVIRTTGLHIEYPHINYVHSHNTKHTLLVGEHLIQTSDIGHHAFVQIAVR